MKKMTFIILAAALVAGCNNTADEKAKEEVTINEPPKNKESETPAPKEEIEEKAESLEENPKAYYLHVLDHIDMTLTKLQKSYQTGSTAALKAGEAESLRRWDKALNEIYGVLKIQLASEEMRELREKQRQWIEMRDVRADGAASEFEGGTLENVTHLIVQRQLTKERCYFLANTYLSEKGQEN